MQRLMLYVSDELKQRVEAVVQQRKAAGDRYANMSAWVAALIEQELNQVGAAETAAKAQEEVSHGRHR